MAIISCPECRRSISDQAAACPGCGHPMRGAMRTDAPPARSRGAALAAVFAALGVLVLVAGVGGWLWLRAVQARVEPRAGEELVDFMEAEQAAEEPADFSGTGEGTRLQPPADGGIYEMSAVEVQPELVNRGEVARLLQRNYPPLLRDAGITGSVHLRFVIDEDGTVAPGSVEVTEATHAEFATAARTLAARMLFDPARVNGRPARVWGEIPIHFVLEP